MPFNQQMLEELGAWCWNDPDLADVRKHAWRQFFGDDDPRPVKYWGGTEEKLPRERRFLGWFMFDYALPRGEKPAEVAVKRLHSGDVQAEVLQAVSGARFVFAAVKSKIRRSVYLELGGESFEVRSPIWAANVLSQQAVVAHIVPVRHGYWLPAPGWFIWPFTLGPGIRTSLKQLQMDPIATERFLQGRAASEGERDRPSDSRGQKAPRDSTLEKAVARMTEWAKERGYTGLAMSAGEWSSLVLKHMSKMQVGRFTGEVLDRVGEPRSEGELQEMVDLATNIWNNTPQPDRGGKSANQLSGR